MTVSTSKRHWLPALTSFVAAALLWSPAFFRIDATGFGDWQYFHHMWETGRVCLERYGEFALWDPFHCGGVTLFGNPQNQLFSPFFWLSFVVGTTIAIKLAVVTYAAVGLWGAYLLALHEYALRPVGAATASVVFSASGFFAWHIAGGHAGFLPFYLAPLLLLCWRRSPGDLRYSVATAGLLVLTVLKGGVYPFAWSVLLLLADVSWRVWSRSKLREVFWSGLVVATLTLVTCGVRLLAIGAQLGSSPRSTPLHDSVQLGELVSFLTARTHSWNVPGHPYVWPEYCAFIGWGALSMTVIGAILVIARRQHLHLVFMLLFFVSLAVGHHGAWSPWALLHSLPVYDSLRVPSRFLVFVLLFSGLLAGTAIDVLGNALPKPTLAKTIGLSIIIADILWFSVPVMNQWTRPPITEEPHAAHFHLTDAPHHIYPQLPQMGLGTRSCYEPMVVRVAPGLWSGDVAQVRVVEGEGHVIEESRTCNTITAHVTAQTHARVTFNQNHAPGWSAHTGTIVDGPQLETLVAPGDHVVILSYRPKTLWPGVASTLAGLVLAFALWAYGLRRSRRAADNQ